MVRLRLTRLGRKNLPFYRIIVTDSRAPRDSASIETIGYYDPKTNPSNIKVDLARVDYWLSVGASPSETVSSLISKARKAAQPAG
jgi:small subunit ribosomal protein S16